MLGPHRQQFITDVPSTDGDCFFNAVALALCPPAVLYMKEESRQLILTQMVRTLNRRGISSPVNVTSVSKFEKKIPNLAINVFTLEERHGAIIPLCHSAQPGTAATQVNILLLQDSRGEHHYVHINDFDQLAKERGGKLRFHCFDCSASFSRRSALRSHFQECKEENNKQQTFEYPTPDTVFFLVFPSALTLGT